MMILLLGIPIMGRNSVFRRIIVRAFKKVELVVKREAGSLFADAANTYEKEPALSPSFIPIFLLIFTIATTRSFASWHNEQPVISASSNPISPSTPPAQK